MASSKPLFASLPPQARFACTGLVLLGALTLLASSVGALFLIAEYPPKNPTGAGIVAGLLAYFFVLGGGAIAAATLLYLKKPIGRVLAWCVLPFFLVSNLIFLVIAIFIIKALHSQDMRIHLGLGAPDEELPDREVEELWRDRPRRRPTAVDETDGYRSEEPGERKPRRRAPDGYREE